MHKKTEGKINRIYVNMTSVSVYRSYAKGVLRTKTLIFPKERTMGDCLCLPLSSAIINNNNKTLLIKK